MKIIAPAKINLSLAIRGRTPSGHHLLDSLVGFLDFADDLDLHPAQASSLEVIGAPPTDDAEDNLALKAMHRLETHGVSPHHIRLWKRIPCGGGLGGGSANAAAVLRALGTAIPENTLYHIGQELGADVPVCLFNNPARMQGIGEKITAIADFPVRYLVLVMPQESLATAEVFRQRKHIVFSTETANPMQPQSWFNDLETAASALCPVVGVILERLRGLEDTIIAGMSGSGSTCFAALPCRQTQKQTLALLQRDFPEADVHATTLRGVQDV